MANSSKTVIDLIKQYDFVQLLNKLTFFCHRHHGDGSASYHQTFDRRSFFRRFINSWKSNTESKKETSAIFDFPWNSVHYRLWWIQVSLWTLLLRPQNLIYEAWLGKDYLGLRLAMNLWELIRRKILHNRQAKPF